MNYSFRLDPIPEIFERLNNACLENIAVYNIAIAELIMNKPKYFKIKAVSGWLWDRWNYELSRNLNIVELTDFSIKRTLVKASIDFTSKYREENSKLLVKGDILIPEFRYSENNEDMFFEAKLGKKAFKKRWHIYLPKIKTPVHVKNLDNLDFDLQDTSINLVKIFKTDKRSFWINFFHIDRC